MYTNKNTSLICKTVVFLTICALAFFVFMAYAEEENATAPDTINAAAPAAEPEAVTGVQDPDMIKINNDVYDKDRKGPVSFGHRNHAMDYGISCWDCHHDYVDGENTWSPWDGTMKCIECHDPAENNGDIMKLQTAYHLNCKTCHKDRKVFGNDAQAYRKCTTCHEKQ